MTVRWSNDKFSSLMYTIYAVVPATHVLVAGLNESTELLKLHLKREENTGWTSFQSSCSAFESHHMRILSVLSLWLRVNNLLFFPSCMNDLSHVMIDEVMKLF